MAQHGFTTHSRPHHCSRGHTICHLAGPLHLRSVRPAISSSSTSFSALQSSSHWSSPSPHDRSSGDSLCPLSFQALMFLHDRFSFPGHPLVSPSSLPTLAVLTLLGLPSLPVLSPTFFAFHSFRDSLFVSSSTIPLVPLSLHPLSPFVPLVPLFLHLLPPPSTSSFIAVFTTLSDSYPSAYLHPLVPFHFLVHSIPLASSVSPFSSPESLSLLFPHVQPTQPPCPSLFTFPSPRVPYSHGDSYSHWSPCFFPIVRLPIDSYLPLIARLARAGPTSSRSSISFLSATFLRPSLFRAPFAIHA